MTHKISKYEKIYLSHLDCDAYIINTLTNDCQDIEVGHKVQLDEGTFKVDKLQWFEKSFGKKGDNVTITVEK
jgi:hypothetical protein